MKTLILLLSTSTMMFGTAISQQVVLGDGSTAQGFVRVSLSNPCTTVSGTYEGTGVKTFYINGSGLLSFSLNPNDTCNPLNTFYNAVWTTCSLGQLGATSLNPCPRGGATWTEKWNVLTSGSPVSISQLLTPVTLPLLPGVTPPLTLSGGLLGMLNSGVTPGSYSSANITVDAFGRVVLASNGSGSSIASNLNFTQGNGSGGIQDSGKAVPSGAVVGTTDTQSLSNKTIDGVSPSTMAFMDATGSIQTQINSKQNSLGFTPENVANKDAVSGYAGLDGAGKLKTSEAPTWNQSTSGNAATASALASNPSICNSGQAPLGVLANGNATGCASLMPVSQSTLIPGALSMLGHYDGVSLTQPSYGSNGTGANPRGLFAPSGMCADTTNNLEFVADTSNGRITAYPLAAGVMSSTTASFVLGSATNTFGSIGIGQYAGNFVALACDPTHNRLFAVDQGQNRVLVFNTNISTISTGEVALNVLGQTNFTNVGAATTQSGFSSPTGVAYDSANNRLFVADYLNNRIMVFDVSSISNGQNAVHVIGQSLYSTNTGQTTQAGLLRPVSVAYDGPNNRLFVGSYRRVTLYAGAVGSIADGENATFVLGQTSFTVTTTTLFSGNTLVSGSIPASVFIDYDGVNTRLYALDLGPNNNAGVWAFSVPTNNTESQTVPLNSGVPLGGSGTVTIYQPGGTDVLPQNISFNSTTQVLGVADTHNHRVVFFNVNPGSVVFTENPNYGLGHTDETGAPQYTAKVAQNMPTGLTAYNTQGATLDATNHRLFVIDFNDFPNGTSAPRVLVYPLDTSNRVTQNFATKVLGWTDVYTNPASGHSQSLFGRHLSGGAYDGGANIFWIPDSSNNRVLGFNGNPGTIANGENATYVLGQINFTANGTATTQNGLNAPRGVCFDSVNHRLFVMDSGNNRVLVYDAAVATLNSTAIGSGSAQNALYVIGQSLFTTNAAATTQTGLSDPQENCAYDSTNARLFVPDYANNRVLVYSVPIGSSLTGIAATYVFGQTSYVAASTGLTASTFNFNSLGGFVFQGGGGATYDNTWGRLFVADMSNYRVMVFDATVATLGGAGLGESAQAVLFQQDFVSARSGGGYGFQNGNGISLQGDYDPVSNTYFDTQWQPDRIMSFSMIHITTGTLTQGSTAVSYSQPVAVANAQGKSQAFSVYSGSLPNGLILDAATGVLSGVPLSNGTYTFVVEADDNFSSGIFFDRQTITLVIGAGGGGGGPAAISQYSLSGGAPVTLSTSDTVVFVTPVLPALAAGGAAFSCWKVSAFILQSPTNGIGDVKIWYGTNPGTTGSFVESNLGGVAAYTIDGIQIQGRVCNQNASQAAQDMTMTLAGWSMYTSNFGIPFLDATGAQATSATNLKIGITMQSRSLSQVVTPVSIEVDYIR